MLHIDEVMIPGGGSPSWPASEEDPLWCYITVSDSAMVLMGIHLYRCHETEVGVHIGLSNMMIPWGVNANPIRPMELIHEPFAMPDVNEIDNSLIIHRNTICNIV